MSSAIFPVECSFIMSHDFKSTFQESMGRLPEYGEWLLSCDMTSAYDYHRRFLQVLQHNAPGVWNLKMPSHALYLDYLLAAYPDARLVWTHRDPFVATCSRCSIISNHHLRTMDTPDYAWCGQLYPRQGAEHVNRIMRKRRELGHDRFYDQHYADLIRDPIESMCKLYGWLGDDFTPALEEGMRSWLKANPQGKWGKHEYKFEQWGLSMASMRPLFAEYLSNYDVELEG
jgi:hypothetical protein